MMKTKPGPVWRESVVACGFCGELWRTVYRVECEAGLECPQCHAQESTLATHVRDF